MGLFSRKPDGEPAAGSPEIDELQALVQQAGLPEEAHQVALKEIDKLARSGPGTAEYTIGSTYLRYLASLPWNLDTEDRLDIARAQEVLDREHFGLAAVKERILEHLAVRILRSSHKQRILVVDDEKMARTNLEYVLQKEGYEVETAACGHDAGAALEGRRFDAVITDLKMERGDGMQVLHLAKKRDPRIAVIMVTGYATVPAAVEAMKMGSGHFLSKPLKLEEIRSVLREALAANQVRLQPKGPVLCFVGPPGTGKTSLGRSIAASLGKRFVRLSLAGMKDEAQIRGHRRSYVGALPGRIVQEIRRVEAANPVIMLDEIDKLGQEFKGDPAAALLEVLDPEQNRQFADHYLEVPFDLSRVMFIATANTTVPIPAPLLDRLEILYLAGYSENEKQEIAHRHLIPRELGENGLTVENCRFSAEAVVKLIQEYTREAGLRDLQRQVASVCRKRAREVLDGRDGAVEVTVETVGRYLGPPKYHLEVAEIRDRVGVATALAWTENGGQIIFVETAAMRGGGTLILTGSLGSVMKESAQAALSYLRSHTDLYGIENGFFDGHDLHVHVPAGAIPKDGPSAGLTIAAALCSLITGVPCRRDVALSGELTLTGRILPVGGVRDKLLAAQRSGIQTVVLPARNRAELARLPEDVCAGLTIACVQDVSEVMDIALKEAPDG